MPSKPIDISKLLDSVVHLGQERDKKVRIDLVFDPTAGSALVDLILQAFIDVPSKAQVVDTVLTSKVPSISHKSDACIIVGGDSMLLGNVVEAAQQQKVPAVVVIERGKTFFSDEPEQAQAFADATMEENTVSNVAGNAQLPTAGAGIPLDIIIDVDTSLDSARPLEELGTWIVQNIPSKCTAFAANFPFLRHPLGVELGKQNTIQNGAIGLVFFVPGADMPLITLNQAKMILQIASVYGKELDKERVKEVAAVLIGAFGCRAIARRLIAQIPMFGWLVKPVVAASGTMAMALAAVEYYEEEGKLHGLSTYVDKAWVKAEPYVDKGVGIVGKSFKGGSPDAA